MYYTRDGAGSMEKVLRVVYSATTAVSRDGPGRAERVSGAMRIDRISNKNSDVNFNATLTNQLILTYH